MKLLGKFPAYNDRLRSRFKLKERSARDWKVRSTKVDAGDFKHELLNRLRSTMAVNVLNDQNRSTSQIHFICGILSLVTTKYVNKIFDDMY